jgi:hypothetical protein
MTSLSREIVDSIINKDNINANEKIYTALYGKSSEELLARKAEIAKHFFDPEYDGSQAINPEEDPTQEPEETEE